MKFGQLLCVLTSTWAVIYETRNNNLTEWLLLAYLSVWSGVNLVSRFVDAKKPPREEVK